MSCERHPSSPAGHGCPCDASGPRCSDPECVTCYGQLAVDQRNERLFWEKAPPTVVWSVGRDPKGG